MNLVLTGFMGTGKSAVGRVLAARLGWRFVDTDEVITRRHGPIPTTFARDGEAAFRRLERRVAIEVARSSGLVVATGGGMLLDRGNAERLSATGTVVCLTASPDVILARLSADGVERRPLLAGSDPAARVTELLAARARRYATFEQLATDHLAPRDVADLLLRRHPIGGSAA